VTYPEIPDWNFLYAITCAPATFARFPSCLLTITFIVIGRGITPLLIYSAHKVVSFVVFASITLISYSITCFFFFVQSSLSSDSDTRSIPSTQLLVRHHHFSSSTSTTYSTSSVMTLKALKRVFRRTFGSSKTPPEPSQLEHGTSTPHLDWTEMRNDSEPSIQSTKTKDLLAFCTIITMLSYVVLESPVKSGFPVPGALTRL
jgi:hypothetical protein